MMRADIRAVAPMTLRLRRSAFMQDFFHNQAREETELRRLIGAADGSTRAPLGAGLLGRASRGPSAQGRNGITKSSTS